jgi:hypothetical protein
MAICHGVRRWRGRATFLLALTLAVASFVLGHSAFSAGHMPMDSHNSMSDAAMVCLFIAQAGALGLALALAARVTGRGWLLSRNAAFSQIAPSAVLPATASSSAARDGPSLLQVFRL